MSIRGSHNSGPNLLRELYSPRDAEHVLSVSHATLYRLIGANRLDARKIDGKTVITAQSIRRFIADLPRVGDGLVTGPAPRAGD